ncbi:MAG: hypothetical protein NW226_16630 [Microscillaceae bacterium]|nr:hypothetical protein [Microscillaceae bacterium]
MENKIKKFQDLVQRKKDLVEKLGSLLEKEIDIQFEIFVRNAELEVYQQEYYNLKSLISQIMTGLEQLDFEIDNLS